MVDTRLSTVSEKPAFMIPLGWYAILGCMVLGIAILIADFVVPNHDWVVRGQV
jgi:hypothetical protein